MCCLTNEHIPGRLHSKKKFYNYNTQKWFYIIYIYTKDLNKDCPKQEEKALNLIPFCILFSILIYTFLYLFIFQHLHVSHLYVVLAIQISPIDYHVNIRELLDKV